MKTYKHFLLLVLGIVVLAGVVAWSLSVLPKGAQQGELGAGIEQGFKKGVDKNKDTEKGAEKGEVEVLPALEPAPAPAPSPVGSSEATAPLNDGVEPVAVIPVLLEPPQVKAGNKIKVTVGAPNPDSVRAIEIFLQSPNSLQISRMNIWNINGEGQWYGHIPIREDAEPGTWKIATVEITDTQGNLTSYAYGKEIFQTFLVQASQ